MERKPYRSPRLLEYGSLRELTRETGCNIEKDGGSNAACRRT
ncbi:MAG TPA: lasso RiPP family leader peptide-containing protein [Thermoanaerobaculia bacterium]